MSAVIRTKCFDPPFFGSTFRMKVSPGSGCPGHPRTTRRSPSFFSRMSGVGVVTLAARDVELDGEFALPHTTAAHNAILLMAIRMRRLLATWPRGFRPRMRDDTPPYLVAQLWM